MPDQPFLITAKTPEEAVQQFKLYMQDLYEERIGGAELGDVFTIGADDVLSLQLKSTGGLEKSASQLQVKVKPTGGVQTDSNGVAVKLADGSLTSDVDGLSVSDGFDGFGESTELTLDASGAIDLVGTKKFRFHTIDTYSDAAIDDLETMSGGTAGELTLLGLENASRVITIKDSASIRTGGDDLILRNTTERAMFVCISANVWYAVGVLKNPAFDGIQVAAEAKVGNYTLTLDDTIILANPSVGAYTCTVSPTAGSDDGQMWAAGGGFTAATSSIRVGSNGFNIFVRCDSFSGDSLPQGAVIISASLAANGSNASDVDVIAYCEDADSAVAPTDDASYNALSLTTGTAQTISGSGWQSIDITSEVQEVIDRVGYSAGQAIQVVIEDNGDADTQYFASYDSGSNFPYISVNFNTSTQTITIPTSVITGNAGRPFLVVNTSSENSVDITTEGSETINGSVSITLRNQYDAVILIPDGTNVSAYFFHARITDAMVTYLEALVADITQTNLVDKSAAEVITGGWKFGDVTNNTQFQSDGEITLNGTARIYQNMWFDIGSLKAPGTKPAAEVAWGISTAWEFTDGTDDTVGGEKRLPQDMDRTVNPEFKIGWASATADPGDDSKQVVWQLEYLYIALNEDTTAAAQETLTTTTSASTTVNGLTISTITGMDLPGASDQLIKIRVKRLGADGDDDLGDDCVLVGCGMKYVKNKLGVAL